MSGPAATPLQEILPRCRPRWLPPHGQGGRADARAGWVEALSAREPHPSTHPPAHLHTHTPLTTHGPPAAKRDSFSTCSVWRSRASGALWTPAPSAPCSSCPASPRATPCGWATSPRPQRCRCAAGRVFRVQGCRSRAQSCMHAVSPWKNGRAGQVVRCTCVALRCAQPVVPLGAHC